MHTDHLADDGDLWVEWERSSANRRQLTWSTGRMDLRKWAKIADVSDEEIAEEELESSTDDRLALTSSSWASVIQAAETADLLDVLEDSGPAGAVGWLNARGLEWALVARGRRYEPARQNGVVQRWQPGAG